MLKIVLCLFCVRTLLGVDPESVVAITSADSMVPSQVHVLTGQFFLSEVDGVAPGFEPIEIRRVYRSDTDLSCEGEWALFPHDHFVLHLTQRGIEATLQEPQGEVCSYRLSADGKTMVPSIQVPPLPLGREISGRTNPKNNRIVFDKDEQAKDSSFRKATLRLGNGGVRVYAFSKRISAVESLFLLTEEIKPNGNKLVYRHDGEGRLESVTSHNPSKTKTYASLHFDYDGPYTKNRDCSLTYGVDKTLQYRFWRPFERYLHDSFYLESMSGSEIVPSSFMYDFGYALKEGDKRYNKERGPLVQGVQLGEEPTYHVTYYVPGNNDPCLWNRRIHLKNASDPRCAKVKDFLEPVGPNGRLVPTYSFLYEQTTPFGAGKTKIKDALGNETHYQFNPHFQLSRIDFFSPHGLLRTEQFFWRGSDLILHALIDPQRTNSQARQFEYDAFGNVVRETLFGNLTGNCSAPLDLNNLQNGIEHYSIRYTYSTDGFNLPLSKEEESGKILRYTYQAGTDRLTSKTLYDGDQVLLRHLFFYDDDLFLVKSVEENYGNAEEVERKITLYTPNPHHFPEKISEYDDHETLLCQKTFCYNASHQIVEEKRGDIPLKRNVYQGSLLIAQTDPLDQTTTFAYDHRYRLCQRQKGSGPLERFVYDPAGRMTARSEESDGERLTWSYEYDPLHRQIGKMTPDQAKTTFSLDRFGNVLQETLPTAADEEGREIARVTEKRFDFLGRLILCKRPNGDASTYAYNAYGKPTRIGYPDGSTELFFYSTNGVLTTQIDVDGNQTEYTNDVLGRVLSKEIYAPHKALLSTASYAYDALHLRLETNPLGVTTTYTYNAAGQKVREETQHSVTEYGYDPLGRLERTTQGDLTTWTIYDAVGRLIEERKEDAAGQCLQQKLFAYNDEKREVEEISFPGGVRATQRWHYDGLGRLQKVVDPLGHTTSYRYQLSERTVTMTDSQGASEVKTVNALGALAMTTRLNPQGQPIAKEEYFYDRNQNLACQRSTVFAGITPIRQTQTRWIYGPMNRLQEFSRAANSPLERSTQYTYSPKGVLLQVEKPSGQTLTYTYNRLGYLIELASSDGSVHYAYHPNVLGWVLSATDLNAGLTTFRVYDERGNCLKERLANGFTLLRQYDDSNRCRSLELPGALSVVKEYNPLYLKTVSCGPWVHQYVRYDLSGNLLEETLPFQLGTVTHTIDPLHRTTQTQTPFYSQVVASLSPIGKVENLLTQVNGASEQQTFTYDSLGQLVQERDHLYAFDSHYNRLSHNQSDYSVDDLDQWTDWEYDLDGNPLTNGVLQFKYDALDRLIAIERPKQPTIYYSYDPFHRRLSKTALGKTTRFLFDDKEEIGFEENQTFSYRILGDTSRANTKAAVALYLGGTFQIPIHDLQGNIVALLHPETGQWGETYHMSAFGQSSDRSQNPWRYLSKPMDEESGLIYFGRRYYDPNRGRWLTLDPQPDPAKVLNPYAYTCNDPFTWTHPYKSGG